MKRFTVVVAAVLVPILALAEPKTAAEWFGEGETQYNLGNFEKAADAFKQGFALETNASKKAAYLYNVGQAYRQARKCSDAIFFYKRFLALKANDTAKPLSDKQRAETEKFIADLEECAKQEEAAKNRPPDTTLGNDTGSGSGSASAGGGSGSAKKLRVGQAGEGEGEGEGETKPAIAAPPKAIAARLEGGASKASASGVDFPIEGTGVLIAGYPLMLGDKLELDLGAAFGFTPVPYDNTFTNQRHTATFTTVLADVGVGYEVVSKLALRGDFGLGVLAFTGIDQMGSPFTKNGAGTTGALGMFALRVGLSADYAFTRNVFGTITPIAFSYSPASSGLLFSSLVRFDFMAGIGFKI